MLDAEEGFPSSQLKEMLQGVVEKVLGPRGAESGGSYLKECFSQLRSFLDELSESLENSSMEIPPSQKNVSNGMRIRSKPQQQQQQQVKKNWMSNKSQEDNREKDKMNNGEVNGRDDSPLKGFPPLLERAHARKNDAVEAEGLRWQLGKKDDELLKLQKALKAREGDLSTMRVGLWTR